METFNRHAEWARLETDNQQEMLAYVGTSPLAQAIHDDSLHWVITGVPSNDYNGILSTTLMDSTADQAIEQILTHFQVTRLPFVWYINCGTTPTDLPQRLVRQGCTRLDPGQGMALELSGLPNLADSRADLVIRRVSTPDELTAWMDVWTQMNDENRQPREALYNSLLLRPDLQLRHYVAWVADRPVGTAQLFLGQQSAGLYCVAVLPAYQRQKVGTALVLTALQEAYLANYGTVLTGPTSESASMYRQLGFNVFNSSSEVYHSWPDIF